MSDDEPTAPSDRPSTPKVSHAQVTLARLEAIADYLEAAPVGLVITEGSPINDTAIAIRQCVGVLRRVLREGDTLEGPDIE